MRRGQPKKVLPVGKLPLEHLRSLLRHLPKHDPRLLVGPQIGEDAAVIDAGDRYLVVTFPCVLEINGKRDPLKELLKTASPAAFSISPQAR